MKIIWQRLVAQVLEFILVSGVEWILANLSNQWGHEGGDWILLFGITIGWVGNGGVKRLWEWILQWG